MAPDQVPPDQVAPDQVPPDQVAPDHVAPDQVPPDHVAPDHVAPDQVPPDHVAPDHVAPDHVAPDQVPPDQVPPDQVPPDQVPPLGALMPELLLARAGVQFWVGASDASSRLRAVSLGTSLPCPSMWPGVSWKSLAWEVKRYLIWSGVSEGSRESRAAVKPLTTAADCEVPEPRKYLSSTTALEGLEPPTF